MNILGIGGWELLVIFIIMLVIAGPKRMIRWSYQLGLLIGKLRRMWEEAVDLMQKELDESGVDVKLPKQPPTPQTLRNEVNRKLSSTWNQATKPLQESLNEVRSVGQQVNQAAQGKPAQDAPITAPVSLPAGSPDAPAGFGTWNAGATTGDDQGTKNR